MYKYLIFIFYFLLLIGCIGDKKDYESPTFTFDDPLLIKINNTTYKKVYKYSTSQSSITIEGRVNDASGIKSVKQDNELLSLDNNFFSVRVSPEKSDTVFSAEDTNGNIKKITIQLLPDKLPPTIFRVVTNYTVLPDNGIAYIDEASDKKLKISTYITDDFMINDSKNILKLDGTKDFSYSKREGYRYTFYITPVTNNSIYNLQLYSTDFFDNTTVKAIKIYYGFGSIIPSLITSVSPAVKKDLTYYTSVSSINCEFQLNPGSDLLKISSFKINNNEFYNNSNNVSSSFNLTNNTSNFSILIKNDAEKSYYEAIRVIRDTSPPAITINGKQKTGKTFDVSTKSLSVNIDDDSDIKSLYLTYKNNKIEYNSKKFDFTFSDSDELLIDAEDIVGNSASYKIKYIH